MSFKKEASLTNLIVKDLQVQFEMVNFKPRCLYLCLFVDFLLGQFVVGPLIIISFRGAWQNFDYIFGLLGCGALPTFLCTLMGALIFVSFGLTHFYIDEKLQPNPGDKIKFYCWSRLFVLVSFWGDAMLWKGVWEILDSVRLESGWRSNLVMFATVAVLLITTRSLNVAMCSPLGTGYYIDIDDQYLYVVTAWQLQKNSPVIDKILDAFITLLLTILAVCSYHGLWVIIDRWREVFGESLQQASSGSLVYLSIILGFMGFLLQFPNLWLHSQSVHWTLKQVSHQLMLSITLVADVALYHGIWDIVDDLLIQDVGQVTIRPVRFGVVEEELSCHRFQVAKNSLLGDTITHVGGFLCLILLGVSSTVTAGVKRESHRSIDGIMIARFYFTYYCRQKIPQLENKATQVEY